MPNFNPDESDRRLIQLRIDLDNIKKTQDAIYKKVLKSTSIFAPTTIVQSTPVQTVYTGKSNANPTYPICEVPTGTIDGVNRFFSTSRAILAAPKPILILNDAVQDPFNLVDFTYLDNQITYAVAPELNAFHTIWYWPGTGVATSARNFAGGTNSVNWGTSATYKLLGDMSAGIWVKFPSTAFGIIMLRGENSIVQAGNVSYAMLVVGVSGSWNLKYFHDNGINILNGNTFTAGIPNDTWVYLGISRNSVAKTVVAYKGIGGVLSSIGTFTYTNNPDGGTDPACALMLGNQPGGTGSQGDGPLIGALQQHYLSNIVWTSTDHINAMNGTPNSTGLLLACQMGNSPEIDTSSVAGSGIVTGTTLVKGH